MIRKQAIAKFLNRKLASFDWVKAYNHQQLDAELAQLEPKPDFKTVKPWLHQKALFLTLLELKRFLPLFDMGGGKSLLVLMLLSYRKQCGEKPRAIVFVPYLTAVETWVEQVMEHTPWLHCVPLLGTTEQNRNALRGDGDLFVICYQSAVAMVSKTVKSRKRGKNRWQVKAAEVRDCFKAFDMLVMDEVHKVKSPSSLVYYMCRAISAQCEWAMGLTGTPFGKDLADLWSQFNLIDFGETLGPTFGFYQSVFFNEKLNYRGAREYTFKNKLLPVLKRAIKNVSIYYSINEFYDMPLKQYVPVKLLAPEGVGGYARAALTNIRQATGAQRFYEVESNYLKLRQLASGFMTLKGEDNDKLEIKFDSNPKLDALAELIEAIPYGRKFVIFHHFRYTNQLISDRLRELKIKHARVWGGQRDPIGQLRRFKDDPDTLGLVLNDKSGSSSLNLQNANYLIFFEQPDSPIDRQQAERRVWRPGQKERVVIYDFLMRDTADYAINASNKAGADLLKALMQGKRGLMEDAPWD